MSFLDQILGPGATERLFGPQWPDRPAVAPTSSPSQHWPGRMQRLVDQIIEHQVPGLEPELDPEG